MTRDDDMSGRDDQRFVTREERDICRDWAHKRFRADDGKWTDEDCKRNLRRLVEAVDRIEVKK